LTAKTTTGSPNAKPDFYQTQIVTRHAVVTNYASIAKPSPTPALFGVSLAKRAAETRRKRLEKLVYATAQRLVREEQTGPRHAKSVLSSAASGLVLVCFVM
jgi:hypothetical protein